MLTITLLITAIIVVRSITVLVDIDGTLLDASHDVWFHHCVSLYGYERAVEMYRAIVDRDDLAINKSLLLKLYMLKACGFKLVIWTNRAPAQRAMTERNLGRHLSLFSDPIYGAGHKENDIPEGWIHVIDNEPGNLSAGTSSTLIDTFRVPEIDQKGKETA